MKCAKLLAEQIWVWGKKQKQKAVSCSRGGMLHQVCENEIWSMRTLWIMFPWSSRLSRHLKPSKDIYSRVTKTFNTVEHRMSLFVLNSRVIEIKTCYTHVACLESCTKTLCIHLCFTLSPRVSWRWVWRRGKRRKTVSICLSWTPVQCVL